MSKSNSKDNKYIVRDSTNNSINNTRSHSNESLSFFDDGRTDKDNHHIPIKESSIGRCKVDNLDKDGGQSGYKNTPLNYDLKDKRVQRVLALIDAQQHESAISKKLKIPRSTVRNIINFLIRTGKIEPLIKTDKRIWCKAYKILKSPSKVDNLIIHNDVRAELSDSSILPHDGRIAWHCVTLKSKIIARPKTEPIPTNYYKMTGWVGKTFDDDQDRFKIRVTTKNIFIDFSRHSCESLPLDTDTNLEIKYKELAKSFLGRFAEDKGYQIGEPEFSRIPHKESPITKPIADAFEGEIYYREKGIKKDDSGKEGRRGIEGIGKVGAENFAPFVDGILKIPELIKLNIQIPEMLKLHEATVQTMIRSAIQAMIPELIKAVIESTLKSMPEIMKSEVEKQVKEQASSIFKQQPAPDPQKAPLPTGAEVSYG